MQHLLFIFKNFNSTQIELKVVIAYSFMQAKTQEQLLFEQLNA